jgi:phage gp16-like protein
MISKVILAKIHVAKAQLALDDDTYRAMLKSVTGVASAKDLTLAAAEKLLKHMERCGFQPLQKPHRRPRVAAARAAQLSKIEALLTEAKRPWSYLDGMVKRICKVDAVEFCDGEMLGKLIAALQKDANRRESRR